MRAVLDSYAWDDPYFEWKEGKGWLDKTFYVKGNEKDIIMLYDRFRGWCSRVREVKE